MPDTAKITTVEHGEPSALPENNWFWRRVYIFTGTYLALGLIYILSRRLEQQNLLHDVIRLLIGYAALLSLLYVAGASTEALTKMIGAVKTTRKETVSEGPPPSIVTPKRVESAGPEQETP